jgi:hypothetical protein
MKTSFLHLLRMTASSRRCRISVLEFTPVCDYIREGGCRQMPEDMEKISQEFMRMRHSLFAYI